MTMKMIPILMIKNIRSIYATFKIIIFNKTRADSSCQGTLTLREIPGQILEWTDMSHVKCKRL